MGGSSQAGSIKPIDFHGLPAYRLHGPQGATAIVTQQGAQLLSWIPAGGEECLYLSEKADYTGKTAIRGGVPVCFPQFSSQGNLPKHGLVRCESWQWLDQQADASSISVTLGLSDSEATRQVWAHRFAIKLAVRLSAHQVEIALDVENTGEQKFIFTAALHTYLRVGDIGGVRIAGLKGAGYRDAADGNVETTQADVLLKIDGEVDRVYHLAPKLLTVCEHKREVAIQSQGFAETVVWNPGPARCAELIDMPAGDYCHMICIEAACADSSIQLMPGQCWSGSQRLSQLASN